MLYIDYGCKLLVCLIHEHILHYCINTGKENLFPPIVNTYLNIARTEKPDSLKLRHLNRWYDRGVPIDFMVFRNFEAHTILLRLIGGNTKQKTIKYII